MQQPFGVSPHSRDTGANPALSDRLLRSWLRCRRRAWLDRHGPADGRRWSAHRALTLQDQLLSFQTLLPRKPGHGEEACRRGDAGVMGVRLRGVGPAGLALEAHPPLLQRVESPSRWGDHGYRPVLVRQGRNLTREHRLVLALWGRLLAEHQGAPVPQALVLAGSGGLLQQERFTLSSGLQQQLEEVLPRLAADLAASGAMPPLVNDRRKCTLCSWRPLCDGEAAREGHLSEVSGIGGKRRDLLISLGIGSLDDLARSDPDQLAAALEQHGDQHRDVAPQLVAQARVQALGVSRRIDAGSPLPELRRAPGVLIYDIESDSDARDDFLHGLLRLRRGSDGGSGDWPSAAAAATAPYHPVLALQEHGEPRLWRRLRTLLARYPDWPVLHYGETEAVGLLRLAERQGAGDGERSQLRRRLIDVHQRLRRHWLLPVNSYGLKAVAGWQGFQWQQDGVDGARCLLWWRQWRLDRGRPAVPPRLAARPLERIFRYNRDDALATWAVVRWMLDQEAAPGDAPSEPPPRSRQGESDG